MHCVRSITEQWLKERGYHGLVHECGECGCQSSDLMPCASPGQHCRAAIELLPSAENAADGDEWRMVEPQWFDPKDVLPSLPLGSTAEASPVATCRVVKKYQNGRTKEHVVGFWFAVGEWSLGQGSVVSWRYDLPPGSWREGEDQSKLPEGEK